MKEILKVYHRTRSMRRTCEETGVDMGKLRKILITAGEFTSPRYEQIKALYEGGATAEEISEITGLSATAVNSYLPYTKGEYNAENATKNALTIRAHRANKQKRTLGGKDRCLVCGKEYTVNSGSQKYCSSCSPVVRRFAYDVEKAKAYLKK